MRKIWMLALAVLAFAACGDKTPNEERLIAEEKSKYDNFVTAEMEAAFEKLEMPVYRGIDPPSVEGYYRMQALFLATTNSSEAIYLGEFFNDYKFNFYGQNGLKINLKGYEVAKGTDRKSTDREASGTFICGTGNKFSIFQEEYSTKNGYTSTLLAVLSGEIEQGYGAKYIKNFRYAFIMKDRGGNPEVIHAGQGRMFGYDTVESITKEQFEFFEENGRSRAGNYGLMEMLSLLD